MFPKYIWLWYLHWTITWLSFWRGTCWSYFTVKMKYMKKIKYLDGISKRLANTETHDVLSLFLFQLLLHWNTPNFLLCSHKSSKRQRWAKVDQERKQTLLAWKCCTLRLNKCRGYSMQRVWSTKRQRWPTLCSLATVLGHLLLVLCLFSSSESGYKPLPAMAGAAWGSHPAGCGMGHRSHSSATAPG